MAFNDFTGEWEPDTGGGAAAPATETSSGSYLNDVWNTIKSGGGSLLTTGLNVYRDVTVSKENAQARSQPAARTTAAPAPAPGINFNPFPGLFSAYPQADGKGGNAPVIAGGAFGLSPAWLLAAAGLFIVLLILRARG